MRLPQAIEREMEQEAVQDSPRQDTQNDEETSRDNNNNTKHVTNLIHDLKVTLNVGGKIYEVCFCSELLFEFLTKLIDQDVHHHIAKIP